MHRNLYLLILIFNLQNLIKNSQIQFIINQNDTVENKKLKLADLAKKIYRRKFEQELIDHIILKNFNEKDLYNLTDEKLQNILQEQQDKIDTALLAYYEIQSNETDYIKIMKNDREKYGMTFNAYKLLTDNQINLTNLL